MPAQRRFAALDTSFLLTLAAGDDDCAEVIDWLSANNIYPLVTGTVMQELRDAEREDPDPFIRHNALAAQENMATWGVLDASLTPIDNGIAKIIAAKMVEKKVLPDKHDDDGLVVAEAALHGCVMLISFRETLLTAPPAGIKLMLLESDVPDLFVVSPKVVVIYIRSTEIAPASTS
jgi:hypothetical protein